MSSVVLCSVLLAAVACQVRADTSYSYRDDYTYNSGTDAFYKIHTGRVSWPDAKQICNEEKASLLGHDKRDIIIGHGLMKKFPDIAHEVFISNDGKIHIDDSEEDHEMEENYEEYDSQGRRNNNMNLFRSMCNVLTIRGKLSSVRCYQPRAFICKVARSDVHYNSECKVYDTEYTYNATLGSCYKFRATPFSWGQSLAECASEGAHLVVVNSKSEADYLKASVMGKRVFGATRSQEYFWYIGIRSHPEAGDPVYRTIFNQTLAEAGYAEWSPGEPNNYLQLEHCGTFFRNTAQFNDIDCDNRHGFICEKEIPKS